MVLVIEHNLEVIKTADWIIGPEGGDAMYLKEIDERLAGHAALLRRWLEALQRRAAAE